MSKEYIFSILILVQDIKKIDITIENILNNNSQTEILLLDNTNGKDSTVIKNLSKNNIDIVYIDVKGKSIAESYNLGISLAKGNYLNFIYEGVTFDSGSFSKIAKRIADNNSKIICLIPQIMQNGILKKYKMASKIEYVNLIRNPLKINLALESYFIHRLLINKFDEKLIFEDAQIKFILDILMHFPQYDTIVESSVYYLKAKENDTSTNLVQYNKEWYTKSLKSFVIPFLKKIYNDNREIPLYVQEAMLYYIFAKYNCNSKDRNKMILAKKEAKEFFRATGEALEYISSDLIMQLDKSTQIKIPRWLSYQFLLLKNDRLNNKLKIKVKNDMIYIEKGRKQDILLRSIKDEYVDITAINYKKGILDIDFNISIQDILTKDDVEVFIKYNDKKITATKTEVYPLLKVFGITVSKEIPFHVSVEANKIGKIEFYLKYHKQNYLLKTQFQKIQSRLNNSRFSYWKMSRDYYLCNKQNCLVIENKTLLSGAIKEIKYFLARIIRAKEKVFTIKYFVLRFVYFLIKSFVKNKEIWLTFDKLYKAGDNGEYIFKYIKEHQKNIKVYYVLKKESLDYKRLKKYGRNHVLIYGSFKHKLVSVLSTVILDTHANVASYCSFDTLKARNLVCDIFNPEIICIQHGLTMQQLAQYQNRIFDNLKLYCCASKYEIKNIMSTSMYGFNGEYLKLTGLARYDGLKSKPEKIILITPTWRRNIVNSNVAHIKKTHNDFFKNSVYYNTYNNLINDKKLITKAKETGYKIIYLLHPAISAQKQDFVKNDFVDIIAATDDMNYEKILTKSSLMVTDYSGVQYDFAYMRKALVYYHPDELPPHYESGGGVLII